MLLLTTAAHSQATTPSALSFDDPQQWVPLQSSDESHSEGAASLALQVTGWTDLVSVPLGSLGAVGHTVRLDLQVPRTTEWGEARLIVELPSAGEYWRDLGSLSLADAVPGSFGTLAWTIPPDLAAKLSGVYTDLRLHVVINAPAGEYLLDDLRFDLPTATLPPGPVEVPFELALALPEGVTLDRLAIGGREGVRVNDRAVVRLLDGREPVIALAEAGEVNIGVDAEAGSVFSAANVVLRNRARLTGSVFATGTVEKSDALVSGGIHPSTPVTFSERIINRTYTPSTEDVNLEPEQSLYLAPAAYRNVTVKSRARLYLDTGTYVFESLSIEPEAFVYVGGAEVPTEILIRSDFAYKGQFVEPLTAKRQGNILVGYVGVNAVFVDSPFRGTLLAPNADVIVRGGTRHVGTFYGRTVEVHQGALVEASFVARAGEGSGAAAAGLLVVDEVTGGDGTRENPYLVVRDNPHLAGSFALRAGESVAGNGTAVGAGDPGGMAFEWDWQGPTPVFGVLRATSGYEIEPDFGTYVSTAVMVPTGPSDEFVNYDTRVFTLEPGRLFKLEAEVVRFPPDEGDVAAEVDIASPIWVKLAPQVNFGSWWALDAVPSMHMESEVGDATIIADLVSVLDYQLLGTSNSTFSMRSHPGAEERARFGNYRHGSMVGPRYSDFPPDEIWAQCRSLTSVGLVAQSSASMVGVIRTTLEQEVSAACLGPGSYLPWDPILSAARARMGEDQLGMPLPSLLLTMSATCWGSTAKQYAGIQILKNEWFGDEATLAHEMYHGVAETEREGGASDNDISWPHCNNWGCAVVRPAWCPTESNLGGEAVFDWLDTPPWVACRLASGHHTITTRRRCRAQLLGEPLMSCPDPNDFVSCYGLAVPTDG